MAVFPNSLPQHKSTKITEDFKYITDKIGNTKTTYTSATKKIKLVLHPLTLAEKDSVVAHYIANYNESVDLIVNAYNTGTIPVFYTKPPNIQIAGKIHYKITCEFIG